MDRARWWVSSTILCISLAVLFRGMVPPHVMETGQLDPRDWIVPVGVGAALLSVLLRWIAGTWRWPVVLCALLALVMPPMILCVAGSVGQKGRLAIWLHPMPFQIPDVAGRPVVGLLSGPILHGPRGAPNAGFVRAPLWHVLSRQFDLRPLDAMDEVGLAGVRVLLLVQPRAFAPEELVALDQWVRMGGRAIILADPDLHWADERPLGHPLRAPRMTLLGPLLRHWGAEMAPMPARVQGDPVERRLLDDGRMVQISGASHFLPENPDCTSSSAGLILHCRVGRGQAVLVADADFANDALWTADPERPGDSRRWTSDAPAILADFLEPGAGEAMGWRVWLTHADGLPQALRPALVVLALLVGAAFLLSGQGRTKGER